MSDETKPDDPSSVQVTGVPVQPATWTVSSPVAGTGNGAKLPARITTYVISAMTVLGLAALAAGTYLAFGGQDAAASI